MLQLYRKKLGHTVTAVQIDLEMEGFSYEKWGDTQTCKPGDWLVHNNGDTYTIDRESFEATYRQVSPGVYRKSSVVWAKQVDVGGAISTKEGKTCYQSGDYLVFNNKDETDGYAVRQAEFDEMYARIDSE